MCLGICAAIKLEILAGTPVLVPSSGRTAEFNSGVPKAASGSRLLLKAQAQNVAMSLAFYWSGGHSFQTQGQGGAELTF